MKKLLSYALFGTEGRYWNQIPYLMIANAATYPNFHMRFYVQKDLVNYNLFPLLSEPEKLFDNIEIEIMDESIHGTKQTIWRMKPIWEDDVDYLFCRDLDYIVTEMERKAVEKFLQEKDMRSMCMRCYHLHSIPIMAGLCGFKVKEVFECIKNKASTFDKYIQYGIDKLHLDVFVGSNGPEEWIWGCDQKLLGSFFASMLKQGKHLDCPLQTGKDAPLVGWDFTKVLFRDYKNIELPKECDKEIMDFGKDLLGKGFIGQPYCIGGYYTNKIIELACSKGFQIAEVLKKTFKDHPEIVFNLDEGRPE